MIQNHVEKKRKFEDSYLFSNMPNEIITTILFEGFKSERKHNIFFSKEGRFPEVDGKLFQTGRAVCKKWKACSEKAYVWYMNSNNLSVNDFGYNKYGYSVVNSKKQLLENIYNDNINEIRCIQSDHFNQKEKFYELLRKAQNIVALKIKGYQNNDLITLINTVNFSKIEILNLESTYNSEPCDYDVFIEKIQNIQVLSLDQASFTLHLAIKITQSMKNLKVLSLASNCDGAVEKLIGGFPNLESLTVKGIDDRELAVLSTGFSKLKKLNFSGHLKDLSTISNKFSDLKELSISSAWVLNIQPISNSFKKLKKLNIMGSTVMDFKSFDTSFPELEELNVHFSAIKDCDLYSIRNSFPLLKILDVSCTLITSKGVYNFLSSRINKPKIIYLDGKQNTSHYNYYIHKVKEIPNIELICHNSLNDWSCR